MRESLNLGHARSERPARRGAAGLSLPTAEPLENRLFLDRSWIPAGVDANLVEYIQTTEGDDVINIFALQRNEDDDDDDGGGGGGDDDELDLDGDGDDDWGRIVVYVRTPDGVGLYLPEEDCPELVIWAKGGNDIIVADEVLPEVMTWIWENISTDAIFLPINTTTGDTDKAYADMRLSIDAGAGHDYVMCRSNGTLSTGDTVWGGSGRDTILGTTGPDVIMGEQGADMIYAGLGTDHVMGGRGADFIDAEDAAWGPMINEPGIAAGENDTVNAGKGADTIVGDLGQDVLMGGRGNDMIVANARFDYNEGGWVSDSWRRGDADNHSRIYGGAGIDTAFVDPDMEEVLASVENVGARVPPITLLYPMPGMAL